MGHPFSSGGKYLPFLVESVSIEVNGNENMLYRIRQLNPPFIFNNIRVRLLWKSKETVHTISVPNVAVKCHGGTCLEDKDDFQVSVRDGLVPHK